MIKPRRIKWAKHVTRMEESRDASRVLVEERDHLKDPDVEGKIILKWILVNWDGGHGLSLSG